MAIRSLSTASISTGAKRSKFWDQSAVLSIPAVEAIQTISLSSAQASIDFTSIPSTYKHLMIKFQMKSTYAGNFVTGQYRLNGSTSGYADHRAYYGRGFRGASIEGSLTTGYFGAVPAGNYGTANRGFGTLMILDYADTSKHKIANAHIGYDTNETSSEGNYRATLWSNTAAINQITLFLANGNVEAYSTATLYGIKG